MKSQNWQSTGKEYNVSLFPLYLLSEALTLDIKEVTGKAFKKIVLENKKQTHRAFFDKDEWGITAKALFYKIQNKPKWANSVIKNTLFLSNKLTDFSFSIYKQNLSFNSNYKLWRLFFTYCQKFRQLHTWGFVPNILDLPENPLLSNHLLNYLQNKLKNRQKVGKFFSILTTPGKSSIIKKQEINLLKLSLNYTETKFRQHIEKYSWIPFHYQGKPWTEEYFKAEIAKLRKNPRKIKEKLIRFQKEEKNLSKQQARIISLLQINKAHQELFQIARGLMWAKGYRKEHCFLSYYHINKLMKEIAKRVNLTPLQIRYLTPQEMKQALISQKINKKEIIQRTKYTTAIIQNGQTKAFTKVKAKKIIQKLHIPVEVKIEKLEIEGQCAMTGKSEGIVKIINLPAEMKKMQFGDILVAVSTNPHILPAMRKAAAIITDKGGITSHAAIVSREFKIPCIVGTNTATKILKDGDLVEVDADRGVVKILKKR